MRPIEETFKTIRDLQATCLDRGFYQGRAFQAKTEKDGATASPVEAAAWKAKADASYSEATELLDTIKEDLAVVHALVTEVGGDLL